MRRTGIIARRAEPGRQRPPRTSLQRGKARVGRDPIQPGPHRRARAVVAVAGLPRPQHRLLNQVLRFVERAQHPVAVRHQLTPVWLAVHRPIMAYAAAWRSRSDCRPDVISDSADDRSTRGGPNPRPGLQGSHAGTLGPPTAHFAVSWGDYERITLPATATTTSWYPIDIASWGED